MLDRENILNGTQIQVRTWYGATSRVELHGPFWHLVGLWGLDIPYPPLVNLLIRRGLPFAAKRELSYEHELGHLQMLPFALLATIILLMQAWRTNQLRLSRLARLWAGHHALWEMLAEGYVMSRSGPRYKALYAGRRHYELLLFWIGTATLVTLTWPRANLKFE
jgi:hypothetical protein